MMAEKQHPEVEHMLTMIKTAMRVLGYTNRDVERKLGLSSSYLSRLFSGLIDLKFQHIIDIAGAIEMDPVELIYFAYPQPKQPPSKAATRMRTLIGGPAMPALGAQEVARQQAPQGPSQKELEEMMRGMMKKLFAELSKAS
jgi:transcriptional regulator with XRE-family HTH domain